MSIEQLEQRLSAVERSVGELRQRVEEELPSKRGLQAVIGSMADFPEFDDVMENVRKRRERDLAEFDAANGGGP
jgi:hypothetical protein